MTMDVGGMALALDTAADHSTATRARGPRCQRDAAGQVASRGRPLRELKPDSVPTQTAEQTEPISTPPPTPTPTTHSSLVSASQVSRKRKRRVHALDGPGGTFMFRPLQSLHKEAPKTLVPLLYLDRSRLPYYFLDLVSDSSRSRFFRSCRDVFPAHDDGHGHGKVSSTILVARLGHDDGRMYVVERAGDGNTLYAFLKLDPRLLFEDIEGLASPDGTSICLGALELLSRKPNRRKPLSPLEGCPQAPTPVSDRILPMTPCQADAALPQMSSLQGPQMTEEAPAAEVMMAGQVQSFEAQIVDTVAIALPETTPNRPSLHETYESILTQYLNSLYISRASLAYLAKGSLSRARALLGPDGSSDLSVADLTIFLRSMFIEPRNIDKKYKERLPDFISTLTISREGSDTNPTDDSLQVKLKKKAKRVKRPDGALIASEENFVKTWWRSVTESGDVDFLPGTRSEFIRSKTAELRIREILVQVIFALEALALENSPVKDGEELKDQKVGKKMKRTKKKWQDPDVFLELLVDKLCIWRSVEQSDSLPLEHSFDTSCSSGLGDRKCRSSPSWEGQDVLKSFCTEVIIPFYMHRLPETASAVCQKLGHRAGPSPVKRLGRHKAEPGREQESRRRLARVQSDTAPQLRRPGSSVVRSATDGDRTARSAGAGLPSLLSLRKDEIGNRKTAPSHCKRLSQREISIAAVSRASDGQGPIPGAGRRSSLDSQLQEAISTLRKPNRSMAAQDYYLAGPQKRAPFQAGPARVPVPVQAVQVSATPSRSRVSNAFGTDAARRRGGAGGAGGGGYIGVGAAANGYTRSTGFMSDEKDDENRVPSTAKRAKPSPTTFFTGSAERACHRGSVAVGGPVAASAVQETPTKGPVRPSRLPASATAVPEGLRGCGTRPSTSTGTGARSSQEKSRPPIPATPVRHGSSYAPPLGSSTVAASPIKAYFVPALLETPNGPANGSPTAAPTRALNSYHFALSERVSERASERASERSGGSDTGSGSGSGRMQSAGREPLVASPGIPLNENVDDNSDIYQALGWD